MDDVDWSGETKLDVVRMAFGVLGGDPWTEQTCRSVIRSVFHDLC